MNTVNKQEQMRKIRDEIVDLKTSPLYTYRTKNNYFPVIGEGSHNADTVFIGEAPGKNEAKTARPFCGAAGRVLDNLLEHAGLDRKNVYITNIVKDRPPGNRDPTQEEIELYSPFLIRQINIIKPDRIVPLGRFSMRFIMNQYGLEDKVKPISSIHGRLFQSTAPFGSITIIPMFHPAVALYNRNKLPILKKDMKKLSAPAINT